MIAGLASEMPAFFSAANVSFMLDAVGRTLWMTFVGCTVGFIAGLLIAVLRQSRSRILLPLRLLGIAYVEFFRRIPFLVILFLVLFAAQPIIPQASLLTLATIAVVLIATAFLSEIVRAGLESVPAEQREGCETLNFSAAQTLFHVTLPQSWPVILPPATAFVVMFIKDTSLASFIGVAELTFAGKMLVNDGFSPVLGFGTILVLYFAVSYPLARLAARLEKRLAPPGNS
ncbi:MAG: amino acid ABC transporter permease [Parasphingopyxis sp.]|uniref:amino acid ABC transporter permease n=1 Tax=Parasphingopyxis sp. TaxID=1920299 RepID=UPI003F9EFA6D